MSRPARYRLRAPPPPTPLPTREKPEEEEANRSSSDGGRGPAGGRFLGDAGAGGGQAERFPGPALEAHQAHHHPQEQRQEAPQAALAGRLPSLLRSPYGAIRAALWEELMGSSPSLRPIRGSCWFDCCLLNLRLDFPMDLALWGELKGFLSSGRGRR